jgi:hypothetical protein
MCQANDGSIDVREFVAWVKGSDMKARFDFTLYFHAVHLQCCIGLTFYLVLQGPSANNLLLKKTMHTQLGSAGACLAPLSLFRPAFTVFVCALAHTDRWLCAALWSGREWLPLDCQEEQTPGPMLRPNKSAGAKPQPNH